MTGEGDRAPALVLDSNVFVAAAFRPRSSAGDVVGRIRRGEARLVWDEETRGETEHVLRRIPPIDWDDVADLFRDAERFRGGTDPERFADVPDPADRKFAALAAAADAVLLTNDGHLLAGRDASPATILSPGEYVRRGSREEGR